MTPRPINYWEQKAIEELDKLAYKNDGYIWTSSLTTAIREAKTEITKQIDNLPEKVTSASIAISAAVYAILNVGNQIYRNDVSVNVPDKKGTNVFIGGTPKEKSPKCNIFLAASYIIGGGLLYKGNDRKGSGFPLFNGYPPAANWLGDIRNIQKISNFDIVKDGTKKPGDIIEVEQQMVIVPFTLAVE